MMIPINDIFDFINTLDRIVTAENAVRPQVKKVNIPIDNQPKVFERYVPEISRVTFNGNTTLVWFNDGSKCVVNCSAEDKYDRKTAITYAIVKRLLGKVKPDGTVDGNGFGCYLQRIVDAGFDQEKEERLASEKKKTAKAEHLARQAAEKKAAFDKRVEERAKQIILERAAIDRANQIEDDARNIKSKTMLNETTASENSSRSCACNNSNNQPHEEYVRPNKPFSKFTQAEKRAYWRYHNAKRSKA